MQEAPGQRRIPCPVKMNFYPLSPLPLIISTVEAVRSADFKIVFDPTLVRGMSYYTGPIFEIFHG